MDLSRSTGPFDIVDNPLSLDAYPKRITSQAN